MSRNPPSSPIAVVYPALAGVGGLGLQSATAIAGIALRGPVVALGPGILEEWVLDTARPTNVEWRNAPAFRPSWTVREIVRRLRPGRFVQASDSHLARWAADNVGEMKPSAVYTFAQVGLETLEWAAATGVPSVLDNPNGHIRNFAEVYRREWGRWVGGVYRGHPTERTVSRVEREYELADRIRVSSQWAKDSMIASGVSADKIAVIPQPINSGRFFPPIVRPVFEGPLKICFVGSLDVRKGFVYLLRALRAVGTRKVTLRIVGATGDRGCKRLLARELGDLDVQIVPGDPRPTYRESDLFILPSLEDGFGFVVAEALASGLPVIVTDQCGSAEWVRHRETGWIIPAGDTKAIASVLEEACENRSALLEMGKSARASIEARNTSLSLSRLAEWFGRALSPTAAPTGGP